MAEANLAVEREITVKNYLALGSVLLLQAGFFTTALKAHVVFIACGLVILCISLAARAMVIFYCKYSVRLFAIASIYRKAYLRGRDGAHIIAKFNVLREAGGLPDAENLSFKDFLTYRGALATINTFPAIVGLILIGFGGISWIHDPAPSSLLRGGSPIAHNTDLSVFAPRGD
ncbi:hypothetical protein ACU8KI_16105 [Rhizobium leguminosarum]